MMSATDAVPLPDANDDDKTISISKPLPQEQQQEGGDAPPIPTAKDPFGDDGEAEEGESEAGEGEYERGEGTTEGETEEGEEGEGTTEEAETEGGEANDGETEEGETEKEDDEEEEQELEDDGDDDDVTPSEKGPRSPENASTPGSDDGDEAFEGSQSSSQQGGKSYVYDDGKEEDIYGTLEEFLVTTEDTPRNIADVMADISTSLAQISSSLFCLQDHVRIISNPNLSTNARCK